VQQHGNGQSGQGDEEQGRYEIHAATPDFIIFACERRYLNSA
jgi:hypothetical protein